MLVEITDFNNATGVLAEHYGDDCIKIEEALHDMPLQLKASDQKGIQGVPIFDPKGANARIKEMLEAKGFQSAFPVPQNFRCFGTDIDFVSNGLLVEAQFSNYPFLLNNLLRAELFFKKGTPLPKMAMRVAVIITKAHMFPASQSTLYYEQARDQLGVLAESGAFDVPMRLIGLFAPKDEPFDAAFNEWSNPRYSRTLIKTETRQVVARPGQRSGSRCTIEFDDS